MGGDINALKAAIVPLQNEEQNGATKDDKAVLEKSEVVKVLTHVTPSITVTNIRRLGKFDENRTIGRPIKVTLGE
ncbi:unnamed protein product [Acanthoscelides obtectus]|uniref:Uncharacterized protein n=1 Tax=Acanthoscelides obtectus TaxID=200917 RepID=A0A9P0NUW9_ACAOB|nr:unnamed protein product [Acanthoscelides obtectus]CAK1642865.1 hypothetical protein AOBTE_LOCUS13251 [Acanthoscelides obtectus]